MTSKQRLKRVLELIEAVLEEGDLYDEGLEQAMEIVEDVIEANSN